MTTCVICKLPIDQENQIGLECESCDAHFHAAHLQKWVRSKDFCPICKSTFTEEFQFELTSMTPFEYIEGEYQGKTIKERPPTSESLTYRLVYTLIKSITFWPKFLLVIVLVVSIFVFITRAFFFL